MPDDPADYWQLDPEITQLNHGSFGACPEPILRAQQALRARMEREPTRFFTREAPEFAERARSALGDFVDVDARDLVLVPNATAALNSVLRSLPLRPGDEILISDHQYNATRNMTQFAARRAGARVVTAQIPFPLGTDDETDASDTIVAAVMRRVGPRTRLAVLDHVTSPTGLVLPIERLIRALSGSGVETLVDGAHAPGMLPLSIRTLAPAYYTGNCHKWVCAPKVAGFLYVRPDLQREVRPALISHGASLAPDDRDRFQAEFGWMGTDDPTARLILPETIDFMSSLLPGGWPALMQRNRALCLAGRALVAEALECALPCPDEMIGGLATLPLPDSSPQLAPASLSALLSDPLHDTLLDEYGIEVPILGCPAHPGRMIRISAQLYNRREHYVKLADALRQLL